MGGLGFGELLIILAILVVIFGAGRLPQLGDSIGRALRNFKRSAKQDDRIEVLPGKETPELTDDPKKRGEPK